MNQDTNTSPINPARLIEAVRKLGASDAMAGPICLALAANAANIAMPEFSDWPVASQSIPSAIFLKICMQILPPGVFNRDELVSCHQRVCDSMLALPLEQAKQVNFVADVGAWLARLGVVAANVTAIEDAITDFRDNHLFELETHQLSLTPEGRVLAKTEIDAIRANQKENERQIARRFEPEATGEIVHHGWRS